MALELSSFSQKVFKKSYEKNGGLGWESPFILKDLLPKCELAFHAQYDNAHKMFSAHELSHLNHIVWGWVSRLEKSLQQKLSPQINFLKDRKIAFCEVELRISRNYSLAGLHLFINRELKFIKNKALVINVEPKVEINADESTPFYILKLKLKL